MAASCRIVLSVCLLVCVAYSNLALENVASDAEDAGPTLLEVFQAYPPPLGAHELEGSSACSYTLMEHTFGYSAGIPWTGKHATQVIFSFLVGTYRPLCGDNWDVAILNLSMISYGRQFDRLGVSCL
jgi:Peptide N-acetyl-beta-D-glucosaminyl asparaginase amidase A